MLLLDHKVVLPTLEGGVEEHPDNVDSSDLSSESDVTDLSDNSSSTLGALDT